MTEDLLLEVLDSGNSADNPPSLQTRLILGDLRGKESSYYMDKLYGKDLTLEQKHDVARAMVLAQSEVGLRDPIVRRLTEHTIRRSISSYKSGSYRLGFDSNGRGVGDYRWERYMDRVCGTISSHETQINRGNSYERRLHIAGGGEELKLTVREDSSDGRFSWRARGSSKTKPRHRKLVAELNRISEDYEARVSLADRYQKANIYPGLTADEQVKIQWKLNMLNWSLSLPESIPGLRPGKYFGDEPSIQDRGTTRIYTLRCEECLQPAAVDVVYPVNGRAPKSWGSDDPKLIGHRVLEERSLGGYLEKFHRAKSCSSVLAFNGRTGAVEDVRERTVEAAN